MSEQTEQKRLIYIGFWAHELRDMIEYLETSGYANNDLVNHIKKIVDNAEGKRG